MHHSFVDLIFDHYLAKAFPSYDLDASVAYPVDEKIDVYYQRGSEPMRPFEGSGLKVQYNRITNFWSTKLIICFPKIVFLRSRTE